MAFDRKVTLDQAAAILEILSDPGQLSNVSPLSGKKITDLCQGAFEVGINRQLHCLTPVRSRSVPQTVYVSDSPDARGLAEEADVRAGQEKILDSLKGSLERVSTYIQRAPLWFYKAAIAEHPRLRSGVNLFVGAANKHDIRLLYMAWLMLPAPQFNEFFQREFTLLYLPEFEKPAIIVFPDKHFTIVLGSGYFGELKKGILRMLWYEASYRNILGLHASTKIVTNTKGKRLAVVTLGLSGTGKTSTVMTRQTGFQAFCQDDFIGFDLDGLGFWGTELGLFLKTEGITPANQPEIYEALMDHRAFWENVFVDACGNPDFNDTTLTPNGRAVMPRTALPRETISHSIDINLRDIDEVVFVLCTRHNTNPILQRLTPAQFAACFALGHTTGTSAGGSAEAGKEKFAEGTDPFIIRQPGVHANLLFNGFKKLMAAGIPFSCLVLNTGYTGEVIKDKIVIEEAMDIDINACSLALAKAWEDEVGFKKCSWLNTEIPVSIADLKPKLTDPAAAFLGHDDFFREMLNRLNDERQRRLKAMNLAPEILKAGLEMYSLFE